MMILLNRYYQEHGTTAFKRIFLAAVAGAVFGALHVFREHRHQKLPANELAAYTVGSAAAFALIAGLLQLKRVLWAGGWFAKLVAVIVFVIGILGMVALLVFAASRML